MVIICGFTDPRGSRKNFGALILGKYSLNVQMQLCCDVLSDLNEKILLRKRNIIETVFDYLKNKMNLEHTRHRSPINAFVHILSTFISYCFKKNKPSINYGFDLSLNYVLIPNWGNIESNKGKISAIDIKLI